MAQLSLYTALAYGAPMIFDSALSQSVACIRSPNLRLRQSSPHDEDKELHVLYCATATFDL